MRDGKFVFNKYKETVKDILKLSFPTLYDSEIDNALNYSIDKRFKNTNVSVINNYKNTILDSTLLEVADFILEKKPIVTAYGCMFAQHGTIYNPIHKLIDVYVGNRVKYKAEMFKYPKGSELYNKFNLLQLLAKIDANGLYGVMGAPSSIMYNIYVAGSITCNSRTAIACAILFFESFLSNNVKFGSLNDVVTFIHNIKNEKRNYNDYDILDRNITLAEAFTKVMYTTGFEWIPTDKEMNIIWDIMTNLTQEDLNRIYYKNNLYSFCDNPAITKAILYLLENLDTPFLNPNKPPKEISVELSELLDIIKEYIFYDHLYIDKFDRIEMMIRDTSIITDTDSCIVNIDAWLRYVLDKTVGVDMKLKTIDSEVVDYVLGDNMEESAIKTKETEMVKDFDFANDQVIEIAKSVEPTVVSSGEGLRYSIINIMGYILGDLVNEYMKTYTKYYNSYQESRPCLLSMKNEFLMKRIVGTSVKKAYASKLELQEGFQVPEKESLKITGLVMDKVVLNESVRERLQKILYEDILDKPKIDQVQILKNIAILEKEIFNSLRNGQKDFYKPARIKSITSYEDPMSIQGIKAATVYNKIKEESMDPIDLYSKNTVDILKVDINPKNILSLKETNERVYNALTELMEIKVFKGGIETIAIPEEETIPEWLKDYIDYVSIINDNLCNFPLESVGLNRSGKSTVNYTNIISF